jgi:hypothetical protein
MTNSSASSICELSRSKRRYHDQDALLNGFIGCGGYTAKEVAVEVLDWKYEQYANSPKRAFDLFKLGYLEQLEGRECRQSGKSAHTYRVTDKGMAHVRKHYGICKPHGSNEGLVHVSVVNADVVSAKRQLSDIKSILGGDCVKR